MGHTRNERPNTQNTQQQNLPWFDIDIISFEKQQQQQKPKQHINIIPCVVMNNQNETPLNTFIADLLDKSDLPVTLSQDNAKAPMTMTKITFPTSKPCNRWGNSSPSASKLVYGGGKDGGSATEPSCSLPSVPPLHHHHPIGDTSNSPICRWGDSTSPGSSQSNSSSPALPSRKGFPNETVVDRDNGVEDEDDDDGHDQQQRQQQHKPASRMGKSVAGGSKSKTVIPPSLRKLPYE